MKTTVSLVLVSVLLAILVAACGPTPGSSPAPSAGPAATGMPAATGVPSPAASPTALPAPTGTAAAGLPITAPCAILSKDEVAAVLGQAITQVKENIKGINAPISPAYSCLYVGSNESIILIIAQSGAAQGSGEWQKLQSDFAASVVAAGNNTPAPGLGDWAMWLDNGKDAGGYAVTRYPYLFGLVVGGLNGSPLPYQAGLKNLVALAVSRVAP